MVLSDQLPGILWKSQHLLLCLPEPTFCPIPSHINPVQAIKFNFLKMHFNIILQSNPKSSKRSHSLRFTKKHLRKQVSFPTCVASHPPWFHHPNNIFFRNPSLRDFLHCPIPTSFLGSNTILSKLSSTNKRNIYIYCQNHKPSLHSLRHITYKTRLCRFTVWFGLCLDSSDEQLDWNMSFIYH